MSRIELEADRLGMVMRELVFSKLRQPVAVFQFLQQAVGDLKQGVSELAFLEGDQNG